MSMASSSSATITSSPANTISRYNVFLSFRGEDTRNSFTDHLYDALVRAGLHTFRDNDEIERGEEVNLAIVRAIEASEASIVILSANYAGSTWCLDELQLILEERRVRNHFVLPVFYHVDPSDVRKQSKDFMIEVKSSGRWSVHNVNRWKAALTEVADLAGLVLFGPETIFLKKIVDTVYNKLDRKQVHLPPNLIGMDVRVKEISSWLKQPDTSFIVICGMGGSGKTTLARYIVYSNWQNFDNISIIEDIGSRCKEPHDLLQLQEKLFGDIFWGKKRKIPSVCQGTYTFQIEEALQKNKALIILDDIVEQSQLFAFLGSADINKQSKIVITTREINTLKWFESRSWRCHEYKMQLLDDDESLELLSLHAFRSKIVMEGYEELAKKVLKYCDGNPLALEVLGSSLQEDHSISSWKSALNLLEKDIHPGIYRVLIRSYNLLPYDTDRELFLHIACFFIGIDMDYVVKILEHDYSAMSRIKTLTKRCLLSISPNKKLLMHPLLQEMGRTIVHQESPKDPSKRSRVWCNKESYDLLRKGKGSRTMEGLALDLKILREDKYALKDRIAKVNGVIESIVRSLGRQISEGILAVDLLLELSRNETLKSCIGRVQGCIQLLVTISNHNSTQAATRAHELLDKLSFSDQNVIQMAKAYYFRHLLARLHSGSEEAQMSMVTTLAEMNLKDNMSFLFENGAVGSLLHLVLQGNPRMKETAAKALRNLSSSPKNSIHMIKNGSVHSLVNLLYNHTASHHCLQDELAAIIMQLAMSTMSKNDNDPPVSLFESDGDIDSLFSFIGCSRPLVQERLLYSLYAMCHSPSAVTVKTKLRQNPENIHSLVNLLENENHKVRANAFKLFWYLQEDGDDKEIIDHMALRSIETLTKIIKFSSDVEEIAFAMGVISNLTQSSQLTESLLKAGGLPLISSCLRDAMQNRLHQKQLIENTVGSLCHFTIPTNQRSQKKVAKTGVIPLLVQLLELGTSLTKIKASISLGQLSKSSFELTHPIPRPLGIIFRRFSRRSECPVHQGICSVETSFCLVKADAVSPLVGLLGDPDLDVCEASLDALLTLTEAEMLPYGSKILAEANAIHPIIQLLKSPSASLQEKVLIALERMFQLLDFKQKYGKLAQIPLLELTREGNDRAKSLAAQILGQL